VGLVLGKISRFRVAFLTTIALSGGSHFNQVSAESLKQAMASAYAGNSTLRSERAKLRATDELVPEALSGWRPVVTAQGTATQESSDTNKSKRSSINPKTLSITLSQPLFRGFKTVEGTKVAEANVRAERAQLLSVEQSVLFNTVQAYMNVLRDRQILGLRRTNVSFLQKQLQASQARFNAGELTRTDVAQSRSSLSGAQASVAVAVANLKASEANFVTVVGHQPGKLDNVRLAQRPASLDHALSLAQETNPNILAAAFLEEAATHSVEVARGDLLPTLSVSGTVSVTDDPQKGVERSDFESIQGTLTVPLYEAGRVYSNVRQSKQTASQRRIDVITAVRTVRENVTNAWNSLVSYQLSLSSIAVQLSASKLSLDGVRQEYQVGSRTTIDVLNAQQALLNVQITNVSAKHDQIVGSYLLLASMGRLTAENLGLGNLYDPTENYDNVRGKWFGTGAETVK
jgi:outer membrane protein